jgi:4-hydroxy-tetrahydrodipicolinate reductase
MKLGIIGFGKMGKSISSLAANRGHEVMWVVNSNSGLPYPTELLQADVAIEFTRPEAAKNNVEICLKAGLPVVSGTTGWLSGLEAAIKLSTQTGTPFVWASNYSIGVNLMFAVHQYLAKLMNGHPDYQPSIEEWHHIHKLDAPSGTALSLANDIISHNHVFHGWEVNSGNCPSGVIPVSAHRTGEIPGTHAVKWISPIDEISVKHVAYSRDGFADGAIRAATWIIGKTGFHTMEAVLGLDKILPTKI